MGQLDHRGKWATISVNLAYRGQQLKISPGYFQMTEQRDIRNLQVKKLKKFRYRGKLGRFFIVISYPEVDCFSLLLQEEINR